MPATIRIINGKPTIVGTDSSADLQPSVAEEQAKPKPRPKGKQRPRPPQKNFVQQLQNDLAYEFKQLRRNPIGGVLTWWTGSWDAAPPPAPWASSAARR